MTPRRKRWLRFAAVTLGWFLIAGLCYRDTNCTFLRAESGWYQVVVHSDELSRMAAVRDFFQHSHHGHYMPFAVLAEIEMTRLFGMHPDAWKWRAILGVALFGGALSSLTYRVAIRHGARRPTAAACSFALTSLIVLHPLLREFIAFPTLIYQLTWLLLFVVTLRALLEAAAHPEQARWVWIAAACGYASMHTIGLGAITSTATGAILGLGLIAEKSGKFPQLSRHRRHWVVAFALLVVMTILHLAAMQLLRAPTDTTAVGQPLSFSTMSGFAISIILRVAESLVGATQLSYFSIESFQSQWPFGLIALVIGLSAWIVMLRATFASPEVERLTRCVLHSFSFFAFLGFLVLIAARVPFEPKPDWFRPYLMNPRYIVPATLILFPSVIALTAMLSRRHNRALSLCCLLIGIAAFVSNESYNHGVYQTLRTARLVHHKTWNKIVAMAQECRSAQLPVPDVPTRALGEFPWHLHDYDPLLRYSLRAEAVDKINYADWETFDAETIDRYAAASPSFQSVVRDLGLFKKEQDFASESGEGPIRRHWRRPVRE